MVVCCLWCVVLEEHSSPGSWDGMGGLGWMHLRGGDMQRSGERVLWHAMGRGTLAPSRKVDAGTPREEDSWNLEHRNGMGYWGGVK